MTGPAIRQALAVSRYQITRSQFEKFVTATGHKVGDNCLVRKDGNWTAQPGRSFKDPGFAQGNDDPAVWEYHAGSVSLRAADSRWCGRGLPEE